jgi:glycosyltransferase involved in cell wall biosynthesis
VSPIPARLGLQQRVLAGYRLPFFDALAATCSRGLGIFAGTPRPDEAVDSHGALQVAKLFPARNRHVLRGKYYLCWQSGLIRWLETWQPDVLVVEANPRYLHTPDAQRWMHARRRPVIGWGLGAADRPGFLNTLTSRLRQGFLAEFDALITYSSQGAGEYARSGFPAERIVIAPNAVAPRPQFPPPERLPHYRGGIATVLFVGRLQTRKRVDFLLRACAALENSQPVQLWIVGDGPARLELENLAGKIYPQARFFGARFGTELDPLFASADLFVMPGTGGLAVQQAMSFALPVIVAEADGTQADLVRTENGWSLPPGDLDALVSTLRQALENVGRLRQMGLASYRIVAEEINLENMLNAFERAVQLVCTGNTFADADTE